MKLAATANACRLLGEASKEHGAASAALFFFWLRGYKQVTPNGACSGKTRLKLVKPVDGSVTEVR